MKDFLFEESLEVYAVPIGPSYIKPNSYKTPQFSSSNPTPTSTSPYTRPTARSSNPYITSYAGPSPIESKSQNLYKHIPLRNQEPDISPPSARELYSRPAPTPLPSSSLPQERSHPYASFLPPPRTVQEHTNYHPNTIVSDDTRTPGSVQPNGPDANSWKPGPVEPDLVEYLESDSDYILDYLERSFYSLPDYGDYFPDYGPQPRQSFAPSRYHGRHHWSSLLDEKAVKKR